MTCPENIIIKIYEKIKIIRVDASDNLIRKYEKKSSDGYLEINLDEKTNEIHLVLYNVMKHEQLPEEKTVHLNIKLSEFNFLNLTAKRVEFNSNRVFDLTSFYAIEFGTENDYTDLKSTLYSLKEIYIDEKMDSLDDCSFFMEPEKQIEEKMDSSDEVAYKKSYIITVEDPVSINKLCDNLKEAISKGDLDNSTKYATELTKLKATLDISIKKVEIKDEKVEKIQDIDSDMHKINLIFKNQNDKNFQFYLNAFETTILDLKKKIFNDHKIPVEYQFIVVNDCSSNDGDKLDFYSHQQNVASSSLKKSEFIVHLFVFSNTLNEWNCSKCTFINTFDSQKCYMCQNLRNIKLDSPNLDQFRDTLEFKIFNEQLEEKLKKQREEKFFEMAALYNLELNENIDPFDCDICMEQNIPPYQGVILKECLHVFCKLCLINHINYCEDSIVKCPFGKDYNCTYNIQDREIRALLNPEEYNKVQMKSLRQSEASMNNTFHCLLPDCIGFCVYEDNLNFFDCPVCEKVNCLRCNVIHMGKTCKEYQDDLKLASANDANAQKDIKALEELIQKKKAMHCPGCKIILCKNDGCDWLVCPMCKVEICWATRGPRWGPKGNGDTSGGCKCNYGQGKPCAPECRNCH